MNITLESMDTRTSVRSYSGAALRHDDRRLIEAAIASSGPCPFGSSPRFMIVEPDVEDEAASGRIGTYGIIKNATAFIVGSTKAGPFAFADYGYALEGIVLAAAGAGLGTCWLGGTFDRSGAVKGLGLAADDIVPAVMPIGEAADRRSILETTMRALVGAKKRKPWAELFFDGTFDKGLSSDDSGIWAPALEAVRRGPSASNKQPWRIVKTGSGADTGFHLFLDEDKAYNNAIRDVRIQELDIGIAMRHFEAAAIALGLPGAWAQLESVPVVYDDPLLYYSSWVI